MISCRNRVTIVSVLVLACVCAAYGDQAETLVAGQDAAKAASVSDGVYNEDQARRGRDKYNQACSACHQVDLSGSDQAPGLVGGDFLDRWDGQSVADFADRIRTSMPADDVGSITTPMSVDIVAYVLQVNGFPAGPDELKAERAALRTVLIKKKS